jgi:hypothetical protein
VIYLETFDKLGFLGLIPNWVIVVSSKLLKCREEEIKETAFGLRI